MRTVAVVALKGGSGKTTLATHLALAAHLRGLDTLVVDTDPQHSSKDVLGARSVDGPTCIVASGPRLMEAQFDAAGRRRDLLIIDTAAGAIENVTEAIVLADLIVMVARPTLMDLAGLARTFMLVRKLGKPSTVVLSQAPVARGGVESPLVTRVLYGLDYMKAPVAPTIIRSRTIYQTALERGRSAEEMTDKAAAREIADLWTYVAETVDLPGGAARARPKTGAAAQPTP